MLVGLHDHELFCIGEWRWSSWLEDCDVVFGLGVIDV